MKKWIRQLALLSITLEVGCNGVPRPDASMCVANVQLLRQKCYNLLHDYDDNGIILPGAIPQVRQYQDATSMLQALDKSINTDPQGWANLKAYLKNLRANN